MTAEGVLVVDKDSGMTSHDVVARVRRLAATRRVGHAGTLDPLATGVLVLGIGRATRLLGHLALHDKEYVAGIRLGATTNTDDVEGEVVATSTAPWDRAAVDRAVTGLVGEHAQVPPAFSAIKVNGTRSYVRARAGEAVELAARTVRVDRFAVTAVTGDVLTAEITCSSGTYVRALARDLGAALGTGAHLVSLRRTRVGDYGLDRAVRLDALAADDLPVVSLAAAVAAAFPCRPLSDNEATELRYGRPLASSGAAGVHGAFAPDGNLIALVEDRGQQARPVVVFEAF